MLTSALRTTAIVVVFLLGAFDHIAKSEEFNLPTSLVRGRAPSSNYDEVCRQISQAAAANGLPVAFLTRVIWQESRFDPAARSRGGAEGLAQFMPATASSRGLLNPFEPMDAIRESASYLRESASYLRELKTTFGNLGLAAAAYNAGPGRLTEWLSGKRQLPQETLSYVQIVTGQTVAAWSAGINESSNEVVPNDIPCSAITSLAKDPDPAKNPEGVLTASNWLPWGVQLLGDWTKGKVLAGYEKLRRTHLAVFGDKDPMIILAYGPSGMSRRFLVRIAEDTQEEAARDCTELRRQGVACFPIRTPTKQEALAKAKRYERLTSCAQTFAPCSIENSWTAGRVPDGG